MKADELDAIREQSKAFGNFSPAELINEIQSQNFRLSEFRSRHTKMEQENERLQRENSQLSKDSIMLIKIKNAWIGIEDYPDAEKAREMADDFYTTVQDILAGEDDES